jgi:Fe2+ or Zn2+ uptake regulation protein
MEKVVKLLKEKGQRFTTQKKEVFCVMKNTPHTVLEILSLLKAKKYEIDKATVYRIMTSFVSLGIAREVHLRDRETRYELTDCEHHHHLVCEDCGGIEDVELSEKTLLNEVQKQSKFKVKSHSLEFFGTCGKCQ